MADESAEEDTTGAAVEALKAKYQELSKDIVRIDKEYLSFHAQEEAQKMRKLMEEKQKLGNKLATGQHQATPKSALKILKAEDGTTVTDPKDIMKVVEQYYSRKLAPGPSVKSGKYLPKDSPRDYPWQNKRAEDKFELARNPELSTKGGLHQAIDDEVAFQECIQTLSHGKAAGPDGVANEVLQALPSSGKRAIHHMLRLMWATGLTPTHWKHSKTILLFKNKGTPLDLGYYRRIIIIMTHWPGNDHL